MGWIDRRRQPWLYASRSEPELIEHIEGQSLLELEQRSVCQRFMTYAKLKGRPIGPPFSMFWAV